jgi:RNA polymerase sigma factor (sigma-70 family)
LLAYDVGRPHDPATAPYPDAPDDGAADAILVRACLDGDAEAWSAVMGKYKRLIYSIPIKFGARPDDAAEIFQAVCADLVAELPRLRRHEALKPWLMRVTRHKTMHWKSRSRRESLFTQADDAPEHLMKADGPGTCLLEEVEREQAVRQAVESLPPRCREMVRLLFYEQPPLPYNEVARRLGLATGSIGFIRGRCLKKLRAQLKAAGF